MTSTPHHMAAMSSDEPRGYGVRGDVRKRLEAQHQAHHDPAVCDLMARAWEEGWRKGRNDDWYAVGGHAANPYRSAP